MNRIYCEKIPNKVYGYWCSKDKAFFEDEKLMMENNLNKKQNFCNCERCGGWSPEKYYEE